RRRQRSSDEQPSPLAEWRLRRSPVLGRDAEIGRFLASDGGVAGRRGEIFPKPRGMDMRRIAALVAALVTSVSMLASGLAKADPAYTFQVGAAVEDITPDAMPCAQYPGPCFPDDKGL